MSELHRLKRVFDSWIGQIRKGKKRRVGVYEEDDALLIINDLGMKMSPEALVFMTENSTRREDFLMQVYIAEDELDLDLIRDNVMIDPLYDPQVYEEEGKVVFAATVDGDEYVIAEFEMQPS